HVARKYDGDQNASPHNFCFRRPIIPSLKLYLLIPCRAKVLLQRVRCIPSLAEGDLAHPLNPTKLKINSLKKEKFIFSQIKEITMNSFFV
ncbi:MAG: hypothetical protein OIN83_06935, partial [Candidatus Methanoperedens sp.]|nr:hypothetical protein [Candidatus Methanoperedens sp.]